MIPQILTLLATLAAPALAGYESARAEVAGNVTERAVEVFADTILRIDLDRAPAVVEAGLSARDDEAHVTLGMRRIRVSTSGLGRSRLDDSPVGVSGIGLRYRVVRGAFELQRIRAEAGVRDRLNTPGAFDVVLRSRSEEVGVGGSARYLPPLPPEVPVVPGDGSRFVTEYADLSLNVRSRMELGGDWTRFEPCDARFGAGCNPSLVPQLSPDLQ